MGCCLEAVGSEAERISTPYSINTSQKRRIGNLLPCEQENTVYYTH